MLKTDIFSDSSYYFKFPFPGKYAVLEKLSAIPRASKGLTENLSLVESEYCAAMTEVVKRKTDVFGDDPVLKLHEATVIVSGDHNHITASWDEENLAIRIPIYGRKDGLHGMLGRKTLTGYAYIEHKASFSSYYWKASLKTPGGFLREPEREVAKSNTPYRPSKGIIEQDLYKGLQGGSCCC